jgi:hypothetical protein
MSMSRSPRRARKNHPSRSSKTAWQLRLTTLQALPAAALADPANAQHVADAQAQVAALTKAIADSQAVVGTLTGELTTAEKTMGA